MFSIHDVIVDPEFRDALRPLNDDERIGLIKSIERDGFRDRLVVWLGHGLLVDGHHRFAIWQDIYAQDPDHEPKILEKAFPDREAVVAWIKANQRARRNDGKSGATRKEVAAVAALPPEERKAAAEQLVTPKTKPPADKPSPRSDGEKWSDQFGEFMKKTRAFVFLGEEVVDEHKAMVVAKLGRFIKEVSSWQTYRRTRKRFLRTLSEKT